MAAQVSSEVASLHNSLPNAPVLNVSPATVAHSATVVTPQMNDSGTGNMVSAAAAVTVAASLQNAVTANEIDQNALRQVLRMSSTHDPRNQLPQTVFFAAFFKLISLLLMRKLYMLQE